MPDYSFTPQFATIRSESPLAGMRPAKAIHSALQFQPQKFLEVKSEQPELISNAWASGLKEGIGDALKGITAAFVTEREKKEKKDEAVIQRAHEEKIAGIKAQKTWEEQDWERRYKEAQIRNLETQVESREKKDKKTPYIKPRGFMFAPDVETKSMPEPEPNKDGTPISPFPEPDEIKGTSAAPLQGIEPFEKSLFAPVSEDQFGSLKGKQKGIAFEIYKPEESILDIAGAAPPSAEPPAQPVTPKELTEAERIAQLSEEQRKALEPELPEAVFVEPPSIKQVKTQELLGNYEDYEEALMARKELARRMPNYDIPDVTEEVTEDGTSYFSIKAPKEKPASKKAEVPEGFFVKEAKLKDGVMEYNLLPKPEVEAEIKSLEQPMGGIDAMLSAIRDIKSIAGGIFPGVGGAGSILKFVPSSDAWNVKDLLKGLESNIAFKTLMDMKAASPTGGALGAVSEKELELLAASLGSINQNLDYEYFLPNLERIEKNILKTKSKINNKIAEINEKSQKFTPIQSTQQNVIEIKTQDEWKKLKSGQKYIFNGVTGTKK